MIKLAIAVIPVLALSAARVHATEVTTTYDVFFSNNVDYPCECSYVFNVDPTQGRAFAIQYRISGVLNWSDLIESFATSGQTTLSVPGGLYVSSDFPSPFNFPPQKNFPTVQVTTFTNPFFNDVDATGVVGGTFDDGPNQYLAEYDYQRLLDFYPNSYTVNCTGACDWTNVIYDYESTTFFTGTITQTVCYNSGPCSIPEPASFGLLAVGAVSAGFAGTRRLLVR